VISKLGVIFKVWIKRILIRNDETCDSDVMMECCVTGVHSISIRDGIEGHNCL
jgi:hypothetical protein